SAKRTMNITKSMRIMKLRPSAKILCAVLLALLAAATRTPAAELGYCGGVKEIGLDVPASPSLLSGDFTITITFDANVPAADRAVMQQALNEWDAILRSRGVNPGTYPISVSYGPLPYPLLASTSTTYSLNGGALIKASTVFATGVTWFVDPTPANDSEFGD